MTPLDIREVIYNLINKYCIDTSPWTSWTAIRGYPDNDVVLASAKKHIYILSPVPIDQIWTQGSAPKNVWEMKIGFWVNESSGGNVEMETWIAEMLSKFQDPKSIHTKTFTVTLGGTTYTNTTLTARAVSVREIRGPSYEMSEIGEIDQMKEYRKEMTIILIA